MNLRLVIQLCGLALILLTILVSLPLTIITIETNGGPWGFGIIGLGLLLPLNILVAFGFTALIRRVDRLRKAFLASHALSLLMGISSMISFPIYPTFIVIIPILLALFGFFRRRATSFQLLVMLLLAITANLILLKWELDFDRSAPITQLF
jgi:hypothetical protein